MNTLARQLAPLLLLALPGCFLFPFKRGTPEQPTVLEFEIDGTHAISADELKEHLVTQASERKVPFFFLRTEHAFDEDAFANDKRRILRYYQARGYYHARIESAQVSQERPGYAKIRVRVSEGEPVRVASVDVQGLEAAPGAREKLGRLPIRKGDVFTEAAYDEARGAIETALKAAGYERSEVVQDAQLDPALTEARVRYQVKPGERFRYGGVFVAGAAKIPRDRIRAEARDVIVPGQIFDATKLPRAQQRVYDLGVFGGVRVAPGPADEARHTIPVVVSVREAPFRTIQAGPSVGIQQSRYDVSAIAGWQHRNWLGGLRKLSLTGRGGYAWVPNFFTPQRSGVVGLLRADFTQPGVLRHVIDFNIRGELEKGIEPAYDFYAERARFGFPVRLGRVFTFTPSVNFDLYHYSNPPTDVTTGQNLTLATCPTRDPNLCLVSYLEQSVALDLRDDPINTRSGVYLAISLQEGFSAFGVGTPYLRLLPEARAFVPLPARTVLALRARFGLVKPSGGAADVPIVAKFMSGGQSAMRGYYYTQLSPVVPSCSDGTTTCSSPTYVPVGGKGLVDGSAEVRFPISGPLGGAVFLDFGNVQLSAEDSLDLRNLQYAVGVGVRYDTPVGPIRADLAYRLPTAAGGGQPGVQIATIEPGGTVVPVEGGALHHDPFVLVHFSIGEAF